MDFATDLLKLQTKYRVYKTVCMDKPIDNKRNSIIIMLNETSDDSIS